MKALRTYTKALIWFKDGKERDGEYFEVNIFANMVIFMDKKGNEHTMPMYFIKEITEYVEDRTQPAEPKSPLNAPSQGASYDA